MHGREAFLEHPAAGFVLKRVLKLSGYAPEGVPLDVITIENIVKNLSAATVGNTIAGVVLVLMYWAAFRKRA